MNRRRTRGRPQNTTKNLMNNMMIKDLKNNIVELMKMLMLWKSLRTFIPVEKRV
jgi:hypothetical protein